MKDYDEMRMRRYVSAAENATRERYRFTLDMDRLSFGRWCIRLSK
jgi:hypothetical protein